MINAPCKDCIERHISCHSSCEKYKKFKEDKEIENKRRQKDVKSKEQNIDRINRLIRRGNYERR